MTKPELRPCADCGLACREASLREEHAPDCPHWKTTMRTVYLVYVQAPATDRRPVPLIVCRTFAAAVYKAAWLRDQLKALKDTVIFDKNGVWDEDYKARIESPLTPFAAAFEDALVTALFDFSPRPDINFTSVLTED